MKNQSYAVYELPYIRDLKDMLEQKEKQMPESLAFTYPKGGSQIADVTVVFCSKAYRNLVGDMEHITVFLMSDIENYMDKGQRHIADGNKKYVNYEIERKKMCCIMFTSGTSGASKGVMSSHENIAEDINGSCQLFVLKGNTIALLPFHHAFGLVVGVLTVFHYGYTTYINKSLKTIQKSLQIAKPQTMFLGHFL